MTPLNLVYWLQGYFELVDAVAPDPILTPEFYGLVSAHVKMCKATPGNFNSELVQAVGWLEFACEAEVPASKFKAKLNSLFVHVIDPMTIDKEVAENQSSAHGGEGWEPLNSPFVRC
jgi:hypothetical protein